MPFSPTPFSTVAAQAQALSVVASLEAGFLSSVASGIRSNTFVSDVGREEVMHVLEREGTAREVGDAFFRANAGGWLQRMQGRYGTERIRGAWHDASRVLQNFEVPFVEEDRETGDLLEVYAESNLVEHGALAGGLGLIDWGLRGRGYFGLSASVHDIETLRDTHWVRFRLLPPTVLEGWTGRLLGPNASRLCMASGFSSPRELSLLHQAAWHAVALPGTAVKVHDYESEPLDAAVHDEGHVVLWSAKIPAPVRIGASLLYDALEEALPEALLKAVDDQASSLLDLGVDLELGGLAMIFGQLENKLERGLMDDVRRRHRLKWEEARRELGDSMDLVWSYPSEDFPKIGA